MDNYICLERGSVRIKAFSPQACRLFSLYHFPSGTVGNFLLSARGEKGGFDLMLDNQETNGNYTVLSFSLMVVGGLRQTAVCLALDQISIHFNAFSLMWTHQELLHLCERMDVKMSLCHLLPADGAFHPSNCQSVSGP